MPLLFPRYAEVAELVDALDSGSSRVTPVGVRVPSSAPNALDPGNLDSVISWLPYNIFENREEEIINY